MEMQKPYDGGALIAALEKEGIKEAEKIARLVIVNVSDWLRSSMKLSTEGVVGKLDDMAIPVVNAFEKFALDKIDGIDGEKDAE